MLNQFIKFAATLHADNKKYLDGNIFLYFSIVFWSSDASFS